MRPSSGRGLKRLLSRESLELGGGGTKHRKTTSHHDSSIPGQNSNTTSRASGTPANASKRRAQSKQVITFDGHTQKALEQMVRDIWTAKSSIRSSRIARTMRGDALGSQMRTRTRVENQRTSCDHLNPDVNASIDADQSVADDANHDRLTEQLELRMLFTKQRIRRNYSATAGSSTANPRRDRASHPLSSPSPCAKECPYDFIECQLDNAQNLCERAAFRFLREGTCLEELDWLQQAYELILEASTTLAEQEKEAESADDIEPAQPKTQLQSHTTSTTSTTTSGNGNVRGKTVGETTVAILEVDDNLADTAEISIDISTFRRARYGYGHHGMQGWQLSRA